MLGVDRVHPTPQLVAYSLLLEHSSLIIPPTIRQSLLVAQYTVTKVIYNLKLKRLLVQTFALILPRV
jgi:hypothetical protein